MDIQEKCMAVSVAVGWDIADELVDKNIMQKVKVAHGPNNEAEMGFIISNEHKEKIESYISKGVEEGANLILDGRLPC